MRVAAVVFPPPAPPIGDGGGVKVFSTPPENAPRTASSARSPTPPRKRRGVKVLVAGLAVAGGTVAFPAFGAEGGLKLLSVTTLIGEIITFAILVWVMMKFVWPPLMGAIESRQKEIADGLAAAEQGKKELADAASSRQQIVAEARASAGKLVGEGEERKAAIVASAREEAEGERSRIVEQGRREVENERAAMRREMQQRVGGLAVVGAAKILRREVDEKAHADIIDSLQKGL